MSHDFIVTVFVCLIGKNLSGENPYILILNVQASENIL